MKSGNNTPPLPLHQELITASVAAATEQSGTEVFISYSRKDSDFARQLNAQLQQAGKTTWFDQESIDTGADFEKALFKGIDSADHILFILSPDAVESEYCENEVNYAASLGKHFITILHRETEPNTIPNALRIIQWLDFRDPTEFETAFLALLRALEQQQTYIHQHTNILAHALYWQQHQKATQHLLIGEQRTAAEQWLLTEFRPPNQPPCQPTPLISEFICEARKNADNRMTDIFVCYDAQDKEIRDTVVQSLSRYAKTCWMHDRDIQKAERYEYAIEQGIEAADNLLYFISPNAVKSEYCQRELTHAVKYHKRIIPLLIAPTPNSDIPEALRGLQYIDLTTDYHNQIDELLNILKHDQEYHKQHKVLLVRSRKWAAENRKTIFLLQGHNLEKAKTWLRLAEKRQQHRPLPLHHELITASDNATRQVGTELFISYSRKDNDFVRQLNTRLTEAGKTVWFDQESQTSNVNTGSGDFETETFNGIDNADNFLFVVSPPSVASRYCVAEINHAVSRGKRIMAVWYRQIDPNTTPAALHDVQRLEFSNPAEFEAAFLELVRTLDREKTYLHQHTEILRHALHWQQQQQATQHLLVGEQRTAAQQWLLTEFLPPNQPPCQPTPLMCDFICEARKNAENLMTDVFICYHAPDQDIRDSVVQSLSRHAKTCWTNDQNSQKGLDYEGAIKQGIEAADNMLFFITPASVTSDSCQQQLAHALKYHKRIIPLLITPTPISDLPDALRSLQSIDLCNNTGQADDDSDINEILNILKSDQDYHKQHKVLLVRALKWANENQKPSFLLRGHNLENAKMWLRLSEKRQQHRPIELHQQLITASEAAKGQLGTEVFISYSRKDSDFARHLNTQLQETGKTTWFDQESISTGVDFEKEILKGIDSADNFVLVLSPDAVKSEYCEREVNYAAEQSKRFISVLHRDTDPTTMPEALQKINWLDFQTNPFEKSFPELVQAIELDREHAHQHTVLQQRASDWNENNRSPDFLLNITACKNAENWQQTALTENKQPVPTALQQDFIIDSRKAIKQANRRRNFQLSSAVVGMMMAMILAFFTAVQMKEAEQAKANAIAQKERAEYFYKKALFSKELANGYSDQQFVKEGQQVFQDTLSDGSQGPEMVWLPAGKFQMGDIHGNGSDAEKTVHEVSVQRFAAGRYEVTVAEFRQFVEATGYQTDAEKEHSCQKDKYDGFYLTDLDWRNPGFTQTDHHPVVCVSWNDAVAYTQWLSEQTGQNYRLPSEAQWEYLAGAGRETPYWWGNSVGKDWANCLDCASQWDKQTAPVDALIPNPFGLYHIAGNVQEWVADAWHDNYQDAPSDGRVWKEGGDSCGRLHRGGGWSDNSLKMRLAYRSGRLDANYRSNSQGFRLTKLAEPLAKPTPLASAMCKLVSKKGVNFRDSLKDGGLGPEMVNIPAGTFKMGDIQGGGDDDEQTVHEVSVGRFAIGRYEVTFAEYDKFADATGRDKPDDEGWGRGNRPVIKVSWHDATAYMEWLSEQTGHQYRLPTEAEWEYAARAGTETEYWWGNDIGTNRANCDRDCGDSFEYTAQVGSFEANPYGLYDTVGNVWEWTCSEYQDEYAGKEQQCADGGSPLVLRGGAWLYGPGVVRAAFRFRFSDDTRFGGVGFRLVQSF